MPKFNYVAMDSRGKETKGTLDVGSQNEAISRLKEMGYFPTKVIEAGKTKEKADKKAKVTSADAKGKKKGGGGFNISIKIPGLGGKVKPKVLTTFTRQLATDCDPYGYPPCINGLNVTPDNSLWTGTGSILHQRLAPNYDNVAWQSPEVGNSFGRFVATATRNNQPCVFSSAQHAVVGLTMTPPTTPTPNPRATPRPRPTPAPRP